MIWKAMSCNDNNAFFKTALSNYATDAACGGAIRHLTDIGYTLEQIVDRLDYPAPKARVQKIMLEYLYESRMLLKEEPSGALLTTSGEFVQEQDAYGRRSMRRIGTAGSGTRGIPWKEICYDPKQNGRLSAVLHEKCEENGETYSYISCRFGSLQCLNNRQREYLTGLYPEGSGSETGILYHRLNQRMREIITKLYEAGEYQGTAYFLTTGEKWRIV